MYLMSPNRTFQAGLSLLLFTTLLLVVLGVFLLPRSLLQSRICSMPFYDSLLSEVCSSSNLHRNASDSTIHTPLQIDTNVGKTVTMNILAASIYVVSLARRTDRRRVMESLREALRLEWLYFDALDKDDVLIDNIIHSVAKWRTNSTTTFEWPDSLEDAQRQSLDVEPLTYDALASNNMTLNPLLCATGDNTIPSYANASSIPFHMRLSRGMIACWYSHTRLIADIVKRTSHIHEDSWDGREGITFVFEDDIDVEWNLKERVERMWVDLPRDWDIVLLGHCWSDESTNPPLTPAFPLHPSYNPKCTHGYVLSPFGARRLLTHLSYAPFAFSRALDQAIAHLISTNRIRSLSVVPSIVVQRRCPVEANATECHFNTMEGDSDIWESEGRRASRWRDSLEDSALDRIQKGEMERFE